MSAPNALALTAVALLFASAVVGAINSDYPRRNRQWLRLAWVLFASSVACFIGSAWWGALS